MIANIPDKIKTQQYHIFLAICIGLISFISFNLGKINSGSTGELKINTNAEIYKAVSAGDLPADGRERVGDIVSTPKPTPKQLDMRVVVSKASDSNKYHYSWCSSWKKIKPENQVWYNTEADAISAGYTLAGNCTR
jgi:hypothetical protein